MIWYIVDKKSYPAPITVADIEFYWEENKRTGMDRATIDNDWATSNMHLEVHFDAYVKGLLEWARFNLERFDTGEFAFLTRDFHELEEIRGWLWEKSGIPSRLNKSISAKEDKELYDEAYNYIDNLVRKFAETYEFEIKID